MLWILPLWHKELPYLLSLPKVSCGFHPFICFPQEQNWIVQITKQTHYNWCPYWWQLLFPGSAGGRELKSHHPKRVTFIAGASQVVPVAKNLPASARVVEPWLQFLGWEDPREEGTATHSSILAWRISWTEELERVQSMGSQKVGHYWSHIVCMHIHIYIPCCCY